MPRPPIVRRRRSVESRSASIPGRPEYRNRPGRTGLDPMDAYREQGYIIGWLIRKLFTGQVRTRKIIFLTLLFFGGLLFILPTLVYVVQIIRGTILTSVLDIGAVLSFLPWLVIGIGLWYAFGVNLLELTHSSPGNSQEEEDVDRHEE